MVSVEDSSREGGEGGLGVGIWHRAYGILCCGAVLEGAIGQQGQHIRLGGEEGSISQQSRQWPEYRTAAETLSMSSSACETTISPL